ncbi:unnamed protein product [Urochloa decumbens]|uniref:Uncharacterized protein n=1 Tax=Urochloa decumbens TaxID=240449 RepID=A0ABC8ZZH5_9POAL
MDARDENVIKGGDPPAAQAAAVEATGGGGELAGLQPVGQDGGVDLAVQGSTGLADAGADLLPQPASDLGGVGSTGLRQRARALRIRDGSGHDHAVAGDLGPAAGGGGIGELGSPNQLAERPLLGMEHVGVADADQQAPLLVPAGRHAGPEQEDPVDFQFRHDGGGHVGAMRYAALLAMFGAAMALIGEQDASRRDQFRALMFWLGGCVGLFRWILSLSRR